MRLLAPLVLASMLFVPAARADIPAPPTPETVMIT